MVHGITGKVMIGIPPAVKQEEVKNRKKIEVQSTVKADALRGDRGF